MSRQIVSIPKPHQGPLAKLLALPEPVFDSVRGALEHLQPSLSLDDLARTVANTSIDFDDSYKILRVLATLYSVRDKWGVDLDKFLDDVLEAAKSSRAPGLSEGDLDWTRAKKYLKELLSLHKTFGISSKAFDISAEHQNLFCDARIITDVRPIFADGCNPPSALEVGRA